MLNIEKVRFLTSIKSQLLDLAVDLKTLSIENAVNEILNIVDQLDDEAGSEKLRLIVKEVANR